MSKAVLALLVVQILFGLNYVASKLILDYMPPLYWGALRMWCAAIVMFAVTPFVVPKERRMIDAAFLRTCLLFGFFGVALNQAFFLLGLHYTTPANSSILNTMTPIVTLALALIAGKEAFSWLKALGVGVAFGGVLVLRRIEDFSLTSETLKGDVFTLLNCVSLALFFILSRTFLKKHSTFWVTAWMFLFGAILLTFAAVPDFLTGVSRGPSQSEIWAMLYNVLAATVVTYFLNSWALARVHSSSVALFIYLQPVISILFGWFVIHEEPTIRMLLAVLTIFSGLSLALWQNPRSQNMPPIAEEL